MSESEGKRELAGFARSIDDLFTRAAEAAGAGPAMEAETDELSADLVADFDEPVADLGEPEAAVDFTEPEPVEEPSIAERDAHPDQPAVAGTTASVEDGLDEEEELTALDHAVDAYLGGDAGQAGEIETLAAELLEQNEVGPVARSVRRLVHAAGNPPDPTIYGIVLALMSPVVLGRLARQIGSERDEERRQEHYEVCRTIGEPMAYAIRDDLAESTDRLARRVHCEALVEMGTVGRKVIEEMVNDDNRFLVRNAVAILGDTGGDRAVELVTTALANPDARVRREALRSMAKLGDPASGELVIGLLDDSDREVQIAAAVAAGELRVERALKSMIAMLDGTKDPDEVIPLIRALGQLGDPTAVLSIEKHAVTSLFSRPRTDVRITAYRALNEMKTPQARRLLNKALSDKNPEVKEAVMGLLNMR